MLDGLPEVFRFAAALAMHPHGRGSLTVVIHYLMGDVLHATEYALTHYLPLTLNEPFLQDSSLGTPYQKWAKFTNDDFDTLDECLRRMLRAVFRRYADAIVHGPETTLASGLSKGQMTAKSAAAWFGAAFEEYHTCVVAREQSQMTLGALVLEGWVDEALCFNRRPRAGDPVPQPSWVAVKATTVDNADRHVVLTLQQQGLVQLRAMRTIWDALGQDIRQNLSLADVTAKHEGTLSEYYLGRSKNA